MRSVIRIQGLKQVLHDQASGSTYEVHVDDLAIPEGSFSAILGQSGCGKTTLLTVLGQLRAVSVDSSVDVFQMHFTGNEKPTDVADVWRHNRRSQANAIRRQHIGFALQSGELLPALTVAENIETPMRVNGYSAKECRQRRDELIEAFGLQHTSQGKNRSLAHWRVNRLSGGEAQRVALARAISHQPGLVFVDEPTASLNRGMARKALTQLQNLRQKADEPSSILMITHDEQLAREFCDLIIRMEPDKEAPANRPAGRVVTVETCEPVPA